MCDRYTNTAGVEEIDEHFGVVLKGDAGTKRSQHRASLALDDRPLRTRA